MEATVKLLEFLPASDWLAMALLFVSWAGYAHFARRRAESRPSILAATNRVRRLWMLQTTYREVRVVDGVVIQNLSSSPSFFASTTILIIGGLLAMLGTSENASTLVRDIPFAARTSNLVFDMKLLLMLAIFVYSFFRFTWSMRQYTFGALLIAARPRPSVSRMKACRARSSPTAPGGSSGWRPKPSTMACAPTIFRSRRSAGSSRRSSSWSRPCVSSTSCTSANFGPTCSMC